ncbi:hypothetical protein H5410_012194 [Solanum commersonii]|uniref:3-hydroxyisobutyryl-CoA hydrolase n=1 Tax=Solanum commersonii TaxID=4109 RepID=A0A9J6AQQ8_SOLCO|nr:hypothetical protein H5410_012194 [Solanum commersonii]
MQSFKSTSILRRFLQKSRLVSQSRSFCGVSSHVIIDEPESTVLVEGKASSRTAILNRPHVLNAINYSIGSRLMKLYKSWEDDPDIGFVVLKVFATPETLIGYHPDAGASFYLSHLPGYLGEYLALTGDKISGAEMISCGLATHYSHSAKTPLIEEQLGTLITDDPSVIERSLENWGEIVHPDPASILHRIETLDKCFSHDTVEEIIDALESEAANQDAWCVATLRKLQETSPLSLKVSLRSIREGRHQTLDQCLRREYRMSVQALSGQITSDFCEGVRARLVDRDLAPKWNPPTLEKVTNDMVDQYFSPLTAFEPELELPTQQREAFT